MSGNRSESPKRWEFYITTALAVAALWFTHNQESQKIRLEIERNHLEAEKTRAEIAAVRQENNRVHASTLLKETTMAIQDVAAQLHAQANWYFEMGLCLGREKAAPRDCWNRKTDFGPLESEEAWSNLDAAISSSLPFLSASEQQQLKDLHGLQDDLAKNLKLAPTTATEASAGNTLLSAASTQVLLASSRFRDSVANSARQTPTTPAN